MKPEGVQEDVLRPFHHGMVSLNGRNIGSLPLFPYKEENIYALKLISVHSLFSPNIG